MIEKNAFLAASDYFESRFSNLYDEYFIKMISPANLVASSILVLMEYKFKSENNKKPLWISNLKSPICETLLENHSEVILNLNNSSLRGLPFRAQRALVKWHNKNYPIHFYEYLLTPMEVLKLQADGIRCISFFKKKSEFTKIISGRDYLSFLIHDLMHADLFFNEKDLHSDMTQFFKLILDRINSREIPNPEDLVSPEQFSMKTELEYIISDMNTHPQHIKQSLESWGERFKIDLKI